MLDSARKFSNGADSPEDRDALDAAGVSHGGMLQPTVAAVAVVLDRSWATIRVRRWSEGERVDLVAGLGPGGLALVAGPPGEAVRREIDHHPRWTSGARAVARFVALGPLVGEPALLPTRVSWPELLAAASNEPPAWVPQVGSVRPSVLWDLAWRPTGSTMRPRQMTFVDLGGAGLAEARPMRDDTAVLTLEEREPRQAWTALCSLLGDIVEARTARERRGETSGAIAPTSGPEQTGAIGPPDDTATDPSAPGG